MIDLEGERDFAQRLAFRHTPQRLACLVLGATPAVFAAVVVTTRRRLISTWRWCAITTLVRFRRNHAAERAEPP
jgi:hypothetical protein